MKIEPHQQMSPSIRTVPLEALESLAGRQASRFDAVLGKREVRAGHSTRGDLEKLNESTSISAELFGNNRSLDILDHVLRHIVTRMDTDPHTRQLAEDVIREEVRMRRAVEQQRSQVRE
ncbi:hypothetical protein [Pseudomonas fluorescens]|uniref:Uncharacterized protein n=1 Tax=Pseudomonas fluorescens TaxID=294 RepID=A0A0F4V718_PSEFL|nr:hypothetical protein [Pseudomonas fluorescens]KJZ64581.1 hypothetical protein VD17_17045 [Pseudomonas fluorescens]